MYHRTLFQFSGRGKDWQYTSAIQCSLMATCPIRQYRKNHCNTPELYLSPCGIIPNNKSKFSSVLTRVALSTLKHKCQQQGSLVPVPYFHRWRCNGRAYTTPSGFRRYYTMNIYSIRKFYFNEKIPLIIIMKQKLVFIKENLILREKGCACFMSQ